MGSAPSETPILESRATPPVKRRVSRACDQCHRTRTRCNGQSPCSRCLDLDHVCQYNREKKKRGKVPRHIQKQREEAAIAVAAFSPRIPDGLLPSVDDYGRRPMIKSEAYAGGCSQVDNAPIMHHFALEKASLHDTFWTDSYGFTQSAPLAQPYHYNAADPLFLDPESACLPPRGEMAHNPDWMFATGGMYLPLTYSYPPVSMPPAYVSMGYPHQYQISTRTSP